MSVSLKVFSSALMFLMLMVEADLTSYDINKIIGAANYFRAKNVEIKGPYGFGASNMQAVQWSDQLADSARQTAMKCPEEHTAGIRWGENIAFATPSGTFNYFDLFKFWFEKEGAAYDMIQNKCIQDQECGHWRQLMWASVRQMGCALNRCENLLVLNTYPGDVLVCHFDNATIHNERPFKSGPPCSECPAGNTCSMNLCVAPGQALVMESAPPTSNAANTMANGTLLMSNKTTN